ncbi:RND superfamily putative drug exporter [Lipingzhangella halophila]|uniref:RND superfamily putative drug exporter n=1 Tax=Lipingzhangella halophila TaxID=1783352 RepID=A0A7W7RM93_9ACTN|nr:MMPL family transporter [Lipingzhangella halophila]MBB4934569.1 RND superfamily putative drug exporter [Lipingzhangella halophila]
MGRFTARRPWTVLIAGLLTLAFCAAVGVPTAASLVLSRFEAQGSESAGVAESLETGFDTGSSNITIVVTAKDGTVDDPEMVAAGTDLTAEIAGQAGVLDAYSYWTHDSTPTMRSDDSTQAVILARAPGDADQVRREVLPEFLDEFTRDTDSYRTQIGGGEAVFLDASNEATADFVRAEMIIFPTVLVLLLLVVRNVALAIAPVVVGLFTMAGTLALLRPVTWFLELSTFALNITLVMGLALGVDYCLFLIYRFREELRAGHPVPEAVERCVAVAGRTVIVSGVTVAASMSVLLALPFDFLRSFAYAGIAVVTAGVTGTVVFLPAVLALLGTRAGRRLWGRGTGTGDRGFWSTTAMWVMRRPVVCGVAVTLVLLAIAAPALGLRFGLPDERTLPESAPSRQAQEQISANFTAEEMDALQVLATGDRPADEEIDAHAAALSRIGGVARVDAPTGAYTDGTRVEEPGSYADRFESGAGVWLSVVPATERLDSDPFGLVEEVRATDAAYPVEVGGYPADLVDYRDSLQERLPVLLALVLGVTFVILFLLTGSVLIPAKATVLNLLSLGVMFGVLVWGFQEGNLAGLLGFTPPGSLELSFPILMFCIAYGLSMDYEVFMLARITEEFERTGDTAQATAVGLQRSGPLITAAGVILAASFAAYATSGVTWLQMLGVGLAVAILVDATLIRALLMPSFMRVAGSANWWAPAPLRRLHNRIGIHH